MWCIVVSHDISTSDKLVVNGGYSGDRFNIKIPSSRYRDAHVIDKTVSPTVLSLTWESIYLGKMLFILRRGPGCILTVLRHRCTKSDTDTEESNINCIWSPINTLRPRPNGRHFPDVILNAFFNENIRISIYMSLNFVSKGSINNIPALV